MYQSSLDYGFPNMKNPQAQPSNVISVSLNRIQPVVRRIYPRILLPHIRQQNSWLIVIQMVTSQMLSPQLKTTTSPFAVNRSRMVSHPFMPIIKPKDTIITHHNHHPTFIIILNFILVLCIMHVSLTLHKPTYQQLISKVNCDDDRKIVSLSLSLSRLSFSIFMIRSIILLSSNESIQFYPEYWWMSVGILPEDDFKCRSSCLIRIIIPAAEKCLEEDASCMWCMAMVMIESDGDSHHHHNVLLIIRCDWNMYDWIMVTVVLCMRREDDADDDDVCYDLLFLPHVLILTCLPFAIFAFRTFCFFFLSLSLSLFYLWQPTPLALKILIHLII